MDPRWSVCRLQKWISVLIPLSRAWFIVSGQWLMFSPTSRLKRRTVHEYYFWTTPTWLDYSVLPSHPNRHLERRLQHSLLTHAYIKCRVITSAAPVLHEYLVVVCLLLIPLKFRKRSTKTHKAILKCMVPISRKDLPDMIQNFNSRK